MHRTVTCTSWWRRSVRRGAHGGKFEALDQADPLGDDGAVALILADSYQPGGLALTPCLARMLACDPDSEYTTSPAVPGTSALVLAADYAVSVDERRPWRGSATPCPGGGPADDRAVSRDDRFSSGYGSHHCNREVHVAARHRDVERLLTPAEFAELFKVNPLTVTRWAVQGRIGSVRTLGGRTTNKEGEVLRLHHEAPHEAGPPGIVQS